MLPSEVWAVVVARAWVGYHAAMTTERKDYAEGEVAAGARDVSGQGEWVPIIDWSSIFPGNRGINRHGRFEHYDVPAGLALKVEPGDKSGPILTAGKPWEFEDGEGTLVPNTVWRTDHGYHLLYTAHLPERGALGLGGETHMCYATSADGYTWTRTVLNQVEHNGSTENNIVANAPADSPFLDPQGTPEERFKAIGQVGGAFFEDSDEKPDPAEVYKHWKQMEYEGDAYTGRRVVFRHWVEGWTSPDGIHWTPKGRVADMPSDGGSAAQYDPETKSYFAYLRVGAVGGRRATGLARTKDFWHWPQAKLVLCPDPQDPPDLSFYSTMYFRYPSNPKLHCALIETYNQFADDNDAQIAFSHDMENWFRPERRPIIQCGELGEPDAGAARPWGGLFELADGRWAVVYRGVTGLHNYTRPEGLLDRGPGVLMMAHWLPHRFCGVEAESEGRFTLSTVVRTQDALRLNYRCGFGGYIIAELIRGVPSRIHPDAEAIPGFAFADCDRMTGDTLNGMMSWNGNGDLSGIGDTVAIRVRMFRAKLFAYSV